MDNKEMENKEKIEEMDKKESRSIFQVITQIITVIYSVFVIGILLGFLFNFFIVMDIFELLFILILFAVPYGLFYINSKKKSKILIAIAVVYEIIVVILCASWPFVQSQISNECGWCNISTYRGE